MYSRTESDNTITAGDRRWRILSAVMETVRSVGMAPSDVPTVSVVLATLNRRHLLPRAIASLQAQRFVDWECVVIDDGSTDGTDELFGSLHDERFRYQWQPNRGLSAARNLGMERARGRYITFLDSDDEYLPDHLAVRVEMLDGRPDLDLVHGGLVVVGASPFVPDFDDETRMISLYECAVGGTFFMRRTVPDVVGPFEPLDFGDDTEFMRRASQIVRVATVEEATYVYHRDTPGSMVTRVIEGSAVSRVPSS